MKKVLFTGASGQVGTALARLAWPDGWVALPLTRADLDLSHATAVAAAIAQHRPTVVINAGAYTTVDKAESEVLLAWRINALAPAALAQACRMAGVPLVHVSTDYVFDGAKAGAWDPGDPTGPLGVYGASKLGGELAVSTSGARHAIVRTAWVVSAIGQNFVRTMLRLGATRPTLRVVADQSGSPTSAADLAEALAAIAVRLAEDPEAPSGTWHFSNAGATSWFGFATEIFRQSRARGGVVPNVEPIATADFPTPARRPANSLLSTVTLQRDWGIAPRPWQDALGPILDELIGPTRGMGQ